MRYIIPLLALLALPATAQEKQYFHVQYGTGFFVDDTGDLLTNNHVIDGCKRVIVHGAQYPQAEAEVKAVDAEHDLALIHAPNVPKGVAMLRENLDDLNPGDPVMLIGYPGSTWKTGNYAIAHAELVSTQGIPKHPEWIQFSDSAQHGNSGGPLMDESGNVIGIVVAMVMLQKQNYQVNTVTGEKKLISTTDSKTDGAIGLSTAEEFLKNQGISYRTSLSGAIASSYRVEQDVADFLVNVQCRTPITAEQAAAMADQPVLEDGER